METSAKLGFVPLHEEIRRVRACGPSGEPGELPGIVDARTLDAEALIAFDAKRSGRVRDVLWHRWLDLPGATSLALLDAQGSLTGLGTIRPSALGFRVGPLMAVTPAGARGILEHLLPLAEGRRVAMDIPAANPRAEPLARELGFVEDFRTVRTVWGRVPQVPWQENYATVMLHLD